jgi:predicted nucleic acid-binding protein
MVTYVLDASAILRYLDSEAGADRVEEIIKDHLGGSNRIIVSAVHWGEIASVTWKRHGIETVEKVFFRLFAFGFEVIPATAERAVQSGLIKAQKKIPYADAFGVELASDSPDHVLLTADFDVEPAKHDINIEFLPAK